MAGPLDPPGTFDGNEVFLQAMNIALSRGSKQLRIPVTTDLYGPGTQNWPYWERELHRSLPMLLDALGRGTPSAHGDRRARAAVG